MKYEYSETFESIAEFICENCRASDGECECLDHRTCPFWSEFDELHKLCVKTDSLADDILHNACTFEPEIPDWERSTSPVMMSCFGI